jgi:hypothetical protein
MGGIAGQAPHAEQGFEIGELDFDALPVRSPEVTAGPSRIDVVADPLHHSPIEVMGTDLIGHSTVSSVIPA